MRNAVIAVVAATLGVAVMSAFAQETGNAPAESKDKPAAVADTAKQAPAQPAATTAAPVKKAKVKSTKFFGTILNIDEKEQKISVKSSKGETQGFAVSAGTKLTKGGNYKAVGFADIKNGDKVFVRMAGDEIEEIHVYVYAKKIEKSSKG